MPVMKEQDVDWSPLNGIKPVIGVRGYSTFTADEGDRIRRFLLENQVPCTLATSHFGLPHPNIIHKIMTRETSFKRNEIRLVGNDVMGEIHARYMDGYPLDHLAKELGGSEAALRRRLKSLGFEMKQQKRVKDKTVLRLLRDGHTQVEVARRVGCRCATVSQIKTRYDKRTPQ